MRTETHWRSIAWALLIFVTVLAFAPSIPTTAGQSTPATSGDPSRFAEMVALLPSVALPLEGMPLAYADLAGQTVALGVTRPTEPTTVDVQAETWSAIRGLPLPYVLSRSAHSTWFDTFGFGLNQIDQTLEFIPSDQSQGPNRIVILRGRFDQGALEAAWARGGYAVVTAGGVPIASRGSSWEIDLDSPIWTLAGNDLDNQALLPGGLLVGAPTRAAVAAVLRFALGSAASMRTQSDVAALLTPPTDELVAATVVAGSGLRVDPLAAMFAPQATGVPNLDAGATAMASAIASMGELPPIRLALIGMTAGGAAGSSFATPEAAPSLTATTTYRFTALMTSSSAAERAAPIVSERLASRVTRDGESFAALFPRQTVAFIPGQALLTIDLESRPGLPRDTIWTLLITRDLAFLAW